MLSKLSDRVNGWLQLFRIITPIMVGLVGFLGWNLSQDIRDKFNDIDNNMVEIRRSVQVLRTDMVCKKDYHKNYDRLLKLIENRFDKVARK